MPDYIAKDVIKYNGDHYHEGDVITIDDAKQADALLKAGLIDLAEGTEIDQPFVHPDSINPDENEGRMDIIRIAIAELDKGNPDNWLADGTTPDLKALSNAVGFTVTAEDRNQAMMEL